MRLRRTRRCACGKLPDGRLLRDDETMFDSTRKDGTVAVRCCECEETYGYIPIDDMTPAFRRLVMTDV